MIVSDSINTYASIPQTTTARMDASSGQPAADAQSDASMYQADNSPAATTSSKVSTEQDGSTVMQYTTISPGGAIMRKNVTLHRADAFAQDPLNPSPMMRRRSDAYEGMMQIF